MSPFLRYPGGEGPTREAGDLPVTSQGVIWFQPFVMAIGLLGLASFAVSANVVLWRGPQAVNSLEEIRGMLEKPALSSAMQETQKEMLEVVRLAAQMDERRRAAETQRMVGSMGLVAGTAIIYLGGILLFVTIDSNPKRRAGSAVGRSPLGGRSSSEPPRFNPATPGVVLIVVGAILIGWSAFDQRGSQDPMGMLSSFKYIGGAR